MKSKETRKVLRLQITFLTICLVLNCGLVHASMTSEVVVYVTEISCFTCPTDPMTWIFNEYLIELKEALRDVGSTDVQVRNVLRDEMDELCESWNIPEETRGNVMVNIDSRYYFINFVPGEMVADFLANYKDYYERIVIFRDVIHEVYRIVDENGDITECKFGDPMAKCMRKESGVMSHFFTALPIILMSGLLDGINPCAFAVLLFFISFVLISTSEEARKRTLMIGSVYIVAVYLAYLMIGLAIVHAFSVAGIPHIIGKIGAILVMILGAINIRDYFRRGKPSLGISSSQWNLVRRYFRKATLPAAFIAGFAVSLFEFPCTGGIYLAILGMLAYRCTFAQGFMYLIMYNIAFVLPLMIILVVSSQRRVLFFSLERWERHRGRHVRLISGLLMIAIGVFILLSGLV